MALGGILKEKKMSVDEVLFRTNGGYDIYMYYYGTVKKKMKRPWPGESDNNPSFGIIAGNEGRWIWKDWVSEEAGNAISFVQRMQGVDFQGAMDMICRDLGLTEQKNFTHRKVTWQVPEVKEKKYERGTFDIMPFEKRHHGFWNPAGVSEVDCNKLNVWAISAGAVSRDGKMVNLHIGKNETAFAYYAEDLKKVKFYMPDRIKDDRFKSTLPGDYIWNYSNLVTQIQGKCDKILIQKSVKDMVVSSLYTPRVCCLEAEKSNVFDRKTNPEFVAKFEDIALEIIVMFGSDKDGINKAKKIMEHNHGYPWRMEHTPIERDPAINDLYSYNVKYGPKAGELFFKQKNII